MDFSLPPEIDELRLKVRDFIARNVMPLEDDRANYDEFENIRLDKLDEMRAKARAEGLWAPQMPKDRGGLGLPMVGWAAFCESPEFAAKWDRLQHAFTRTEPLPRILMAYPACAALQWRPNRELEARRARLDVSFRVLDRSSSYMCPENVSGYALVNDVRDFLRERPSTMRDLALRCGEVLFFFVR